MSAVDLTGEEAETLSVELGVAEPAERPVVPPVIGTPKKRRTSQSTKAPPALIDLSPGLAGWLGYRSWK